MVLASRLTALTSLPSHCLHLARGLLDDSANAWRLRETTTWKERLQTTKTNYLKMQCPQHKPYIAIQLQNSSVPGSEDWTSRTRSYRSMSSAGMVEHRAIDWKRSSGAEISFQYSPDVTISVIKEYLHVFILKYMYKVEVSNWNSLYTFYLYFYFIYILNKMYPKGF